MFPSGGDVDRNQTKILLENNQRYTKRKILPTNVENFFYISLVTLTSSMSSFHKNKKKFTFYHVFQLPLSSIDIESIHIF